jgi:hypothetical protein
VERELKEISGVPLQMKSDGNGGFSADREVGFDENREDGLDSNNR